MTRKQTVIIAALIVFIAGAVVFAVLNRQGESDRGINALPPSDQNPVGSNSPQNAYYSPEVPKDVKLTKPDLEIPVAPGTPDKKLRVFNMKVGKNGYEPSAITVKAGDTVQIKMTALDGDYDLSIPWKGIYQLVKKGETKEISFGTTGSGTFVFECRDYCPAQKIIKGAIIVLP